MDSSICFPEIYDKVLGVWLAVSHNRYNMGPLSIHILERDEHSSVVVVVSYGVIALLDIHAWILRSLQPSFKKKL